MDKMTLGTLIRALRQQHNLTQAKLAAKLGITDKAVSKWERDISYPDIALFPRLADVLGVSTDDLLKRCADMNSPSRLARIFQMSHDIRTPLNVILGSASLAAQNPDDRESVLRYLENIRFSGEYLLKVIDRLMDVATTDSGSDAAPFSAQALERTLKCLPSADFSGKRVLVVEDIELNRQIAGEILRRTGAEVDFAEDGEVCVEQVRKAPADTYDLILMDLGMPNLDGIEATRRIRALPEPEKAAIPIIAMTANVYADNRRAAFDAGMNDFIEKPIVIDRLYDTMKKYLG